MKKLFALLVVLSSAAYGQVNSGPITGGGGGGPATALESPVVIEGTADDFEGNLTFADPTADWTWAWSASGQILAPSGSQALPPYSFAADPDSGIWQSGVGRVMIMTNGAVAGTFYEGNVGFFPAGMLLGQGVGSQMTGFLTLVEANVAGVGSPNLITAPETQSAYTNEGVTAKNYHTLPLAAAGYSFIFCTQDTDGLHITANTADTIRVMDKVTAGAGYIESTAIGSCVTLLAINATEWYATAIHGVWTDGTFTFSDVDETSP